MKTGKFKKIWNLNTKGFKINSNNSELNSWKSNNILTKLLTKSPLILIIKTTLPMTIIPIIIIFNKHNLLEKFVNTSAHISKNTISSTLITSRMDKLLMESISFYVNKDSSLNSPLLLNKKHYLFHYSTPSTR